MARENHEQLRGRAGKIVAILRKTYPRARTALDFTSPLELLVATILSAQCTDARVNIVTKDLFRKYRTAADYAGADPAALEREIRSTGFFRNKTKSIRGAAAKLVADFGGQVPDTMEGLLTLPGVARKTANVVLGSAFGKNEGIAVDTHVTRVARRLGLTRRAEPAKIEQDLLKLIPRNQWSLFSNLIITHGRRTCTARKADCPGCPINHLCPSAFKV